MEALDRINGMAERMPGFVWRLQDDSGNATGIPVTDDPMTAANLTVWESVEALEKFVWKTVHKQFYDRKADWFESSDTAHFVMWWVEEGHRPDLAEALERLEHLNANGNSDTAFGWSHVREATVWKTVQCGEVAA